MPGRSNASLAPSPQVQVHRTGVAVTVTRVPSSVGVNVCGAAVPALNAVGMLTSVVGAGAASGRSSWSGSEVNCDWTRSTTFARLGTPGSSAPRQKLPDSWYQGVVISLVTVPSGAFVYVVTWCQTQKRTSGSGQDEMAAVQVVESLTRLLPGQVGAIASSTWVHVLVPTSGLRPGTCSLLPFVYVTSMTLSPPAAATPPPQG